MKKIFLAFLFSFFFVNPVLANSVYYNGGTASFVAGGYGYADTNTNAKMVANIRITPTSNITVCSIGLNITKVGAGGTPPNVAVWLYNSTDLPTWPLSVADSEFMETTESKPQSSFPSNGDYTTLTYFNFPSCQNLIAYNHYNFVIKPTNFITSVIPDTSFYLGYKLATTTNLISSHYKTNSVPVGAWENFTTNYNFLFDLRNNFITDNSGYSPAGSQITWKGTPTSTCDFNTWPTIANFSAGDIASYGGNMGPIVTWGIAPTLQYYYDTISSQYQFDPNNPNQAWSTDGGVAKITPLTPGYVYYATPYLVRNLAEVRSINRINYSNILAQGTTWEFVISGGPSENNCEGIPLMYPTSTWQYTTTSPSNLINPYNNDSCLEIDTSGIIGQIKYGFCMAIQTMFKPDQNILDKFYNLKDAISQKPPFGYVSIYAGAFENMSASNATTTVDFTNVSEFSFVAVIRTILEWVLYLIFGIWVIKKLSNLSLMG